jgi:hypothetical protein
MPLERHQVEVVGFSQPSRVEGALRMRDIGMDIGRPAELRGYWMLPRPPRYPSKLAQVESVTKCGSTMKGDRR